MNTAAPVVSVLMSCYNSARWLYEAIDSVLGQTFEDFEFIIVDDGSTDKSPDIIRRFAERDARIIAITKDNTGLADSLNAGIQQARGKWIARLDADDICEPTRLEKQLASATENPGFVFVGSGLLEIDENGTALKAYHYPKRHALLVRNLRTARKFPAHSSAFYRTDAVRSMGGYRPRLRRAQDRDLWLRLSEVGEFTAISEPLVRIRKHSAQVSHDESGRRQKIDSRVAIISYWIRCYGFSDPVAAEDGIFESFRDWVEKKLDQERHFEFYDYIARIKMNINCVHKSPFKIFVIIMHVISKPGFLFRYLLMLFISETIPRRLALEWIRQSNTGAAT